MSDKPLDKMTVKELREIAKEIPGVSGYSSMKKDELIALISESQGQVAEETPAEVQAETVQEEAKEETAEAPAEEIQETEPVEAKSEEEAPAEETAEAKQEEDKKPAAKKEEKPAPKKATKAAPKKPGKLETASDYKKAIAALREEKKNIQQSASKKEIKILRRRMNILKKRCRKLKTAA